MEKIRLYCLLLLGFLNLPFSASAIDLSATYATDCDTSCTASFTITADNGTAPYQYSIDNGATFQGSPTFSSLCAAEYPIMVIDANNDTATMSWTVWDFVLYNATTLISDSLQMIYPTSYGACDASITLFPSGGAPPYTYILNGVTQYGNPTFTGLCAGPVNYSVLDSGLQQTCWPVGSSIYNAPLNSGGCDTIVNSQGDSLTHCWWISGTGQVSQSVAGSIDIPNPPQLNVMAIDVTCFGFFDGQLFASVQGGTPPFLYDFGFGFGPSDIMAGLPPGFYNIVVIDANGLMDVTTAMIFEPAELLGFVVGADVSCFGACDGQITMVATGGNGGNVYSLDGGAFQPSPDFFGVCAGMHTVDVFDWNGCFYSESIMIAEPTQLNVTVTGTDPICAGSCDGTIDVLVNGGSAPYLFSLNGLPGQGSGTFTGLCAGTYNIDVVDASGCVVTATYTLFDPIPVVLIISETPASAPGACDGSILVEATGGTGPYDISIDNGATFTNSGAPILFDNLCAGIYDVMAFDVNGCPNISGAISITIIELSSVWPGDANYDGTANNVDYLFVGLANTQTGAPRVPASIAWQAHAAQDWTNDFLINVNHKHADTDGNGTVTAADTNAIQANYDLLHSTPPPFPNTANNNDPALYFVIAQDSVPASEVVTIDVVLGSASNSVNAIHGIAFSINYDTAIVDQGNISLTYPTSFIGTPGVDVWTMANNNYNDGVIDGAITRFDQTNSSGFGVIAQLEVVMPDDVSGKKLTQQKMSFKYDTLYLSTNDILALDATELELTIGWANDSLLIYQETTSIGEVDQSFEVKTYPNPTTGIVTVLADEAVQSYRLYSVTGQQVQTEAVNGQRNFTLDLGALARGIYWLELTGEHATETRQIIKQ